MQKIEKEILKIKKRELTSENIFKITVKTLKEFYPDSCLRYIAYFSRTNNLHDFILSWF